MTERVEFVFIANANGAIQAFQAIGVEAGKSAANVDKLGTQGAASLGKVEAAAGKASGSFGKLGQAAGALGGVASGVIGSTLVGFLSDAARAAAEAEASTARLQAAFDSAGTSTDVYAAELERASQAALQLAFDDEEAADAIATMTTITGDAERSIALLGTAMDLARGRGISLAQASTIVGRVAAGNTEILSRYGIVLEDGATAAEALAALQEKFGGQAEAYGNTQAAAIDRAGVAWANFMETIGGATGPLQTVLGLLPGMTSGFQLVSGAVGGLMSAGSLPALVATMGPLALGIGAATVAVGLAVIAFREWMDGTGELTSALDGLEGTLAGLEDLETAQKFREIAITVDDMTAAASRKTEWDLFKDGETAAGEFTSAIDDALKSANDLGNFELDALADAGMAIKRGWEQGNVSLGEGAQIIRDLQAVIVSGTPEAVDAALGLAQALADDTIEFEDAEARAKSMADAVRAGEEGWYDATRAVEANTDALGENGQAVVDVTQVWEDWRKKQTETATNAIDAIEYFADQAVDAARQQEEEVVAAAEAQADAVVEAAEKAADGQIRAAEKAGKAQVRAAEQAGRDQIRAAERAEAGQVRAAEQAAEAQIAAAEAAAEGQIAAAREAEEAQVEAAEKAANAQIRAAEQAEKGAVRAAQKQANSTIRAAEQAANRQVQAAQNAADQLIAQAEALEEAASGAARAQEERTVAAAQRAHDRRVALAERAADREIEAAQRATQETLFEIDQRLQAANRQAATTANVEINAATDKAFAKISDAAAKYGEDSVEYQNAVAEATADLAREQEAAYEKQAEAQRKAAEEAAEAQRQAEREEQRRIAQAERARDRAIARSAAKQQAIEEQAHQATLRRQEEAARQAEALREEAARRVAEAEAQAQRQLEQVRRAAQREQARAEREAARATAEVRRQIEQNLAAQREAAAQRTAAVEAAAAQNVEAARIQAERNVQIAARAAARETEKVRREVAQNVRAAERETAQEVRAISRETADIQKAAAQEVARVTEEAAGQRVAAEQAIADEATAMKEEVLLAFAEMDPEIAAGLEKLNLIREGGSGEWEIVLDPQTEENLKALEAVFGEDGTLDATGRVTMTTNTDRVRQYIDYLRRVYESGGSWANLRVNVVPDDRALARANGGTVPAAANGRTVLVGEAGPELAMLPVGTRVIPRPASEAMLAAGGGGLGGISLTINGDVYGYADFEAKVGQAAANVLGRALPQAMADRRRALGVA